MTFQVYDTTLRDGAQREGLTYSVVDKLAVARLLDDFGVGFIEGGWPGAVPKDTEFFRRARTELELRHAILVAFGATRKAGVAVDDDPQVRGLLDARTPAVALVAKADLRHVERALRTTAEENLAMIRDTRRPPGGRGAAGLRRRRALLRRLPVRPGVHRRGGGDRAGRRRRAVRALRHQRRDAALPGHRRHRRR